MADRYRVLKGRQLVGGQYLVPGDVFERHPAMRLTAWINGGFVEKVNDDEGPVAKQAVPDGLNDMKKRDLVDVIEGLGHGVNEVVGTGSKGAVTKADLIDFIKANA